MENTQDPSAITSGGCAATSRNPRPKTSVGPVPATICRAVSGAGENKACSTPHLSEANVILSYTPYNWLLCARFRTTCHTALHLERSGY
eukprot:m.113148 g.113148  ORF g.113148 m.113148 type:complete len:89 (-) comp15351_c0_seq1:483-749(-)